jgi:solute carrier family 13 (sodium-dependent dicarboxylate transporter), member 2/3/5
VLALLVPSMTARVCRLVPIILGIIAAFGMRRKSVFADHDDADASIWNVGIKTRGHAKHGGHR